MSSDKINMIIQKVKSSKYKKFSKKSQALKSIKNENQKVYGLDLSISSAVKSFVVSDDETIFNKIINGENFFNENIERNQETAFGLDMDIINLKEDSTKDEMDEYLLERIEKIILFFKNKFKIILTLDNFLITKSKYCTKKKKHSFHIKVLGWKFPCPYVVKYYFNQMGFSEKLDGVDSSVYRTGLIRLSFCSKKGQKRPLLPYYIGDVEPDWLYELNNNVEAKLIYFKNSQWSYVNKYQSVNINEYLDMLEDKNNKKEEKKNTNYADTDKDIINGLIYDFNSIKELINILNLERFSNELEWKKLLWILKNQSFDCFDIFVEVSSKVEKYEGREKTKNIWDKATKNIYPYTIATLFYWAKQDNPIGNYENAFLNLQKKNELFDKSYIKQIIKNNCLDDLDLNLQVMDKEKTIRDILKYVNKFFIKLKNLKGKVIYLEQRENKTILRDKKNFLELLEDCNINFTYAIDNGDEIKILEYPVAKLKDIHNTGRLWLSSPLKRDVQTLTFYPDENKILFDTYNMFKGIPFTREICENKGPDEDDIKPLQEHLLNIWCKGDKGVYDYTVKLLAFYLQNLDVKSGVAIVINGDKGTGKSCIIEKFLKIFGDHGKIVPKLENILGNFNCLLKDVLMVYINEATFTGDKNNINKLRNLITSPEVYVNEKFLPQYTVPSFSNFIIDGNGDQLVCNQGEERRFLILETDNKWKGIDTVEKKKYFEKIIKIKPETMATWLYNIDLTGFNHRIIPVTDKVKETRIDSFDSHDGFFYHLIDEGIHCVFKEEYPIKYLYDEYLEYTKTLKFQINRNKFGREILKKMNIDYKKRCRYEGIKQTVIKFNSIKENKIKFEELFGELQWSD